jgi:hypothetical protein
MLIISKIKYGRVESDVGGLFCFYCKFYFFLIFIYFILINLQQWNLELSPHQI